MAAKRPLLWRLIPLFWVLAIVLAAWLYVRTQVGDLYTVVSASMQPTLTRGDRVWVDYDPETLQRGDLVAFRDRASQTVVKRLVAVEHDEVLLDFDGDLWINGAAPEPPGPWVPLFDDRLLNLRDHFSFGGFYTNPWKVTPGYMELDARDVPFGSYAGLLRYRDPVDNSWLRPDGGWEKGQEMVGDARLRLEVWVEQNTGVLKLELTEQNDRFEVLIGLNQEGVGRVNYRHFEQGQQEPRTGHFAQCTIPLREWIPVVFQNRNNRVQLWMGEQAVIDETYDFNLPAALGSQGERVRFGGTGSWLRFRAVRIDRDLHYTSRGEYGVGRRLTVPPDSVFVLGDHSQESEDSRAFGPIERDRIVGKVRYRLWPKSTRGPL